MDWDFYNVPPPEPSGKGFCLSFLVTFLMFAAFFGTVFGLLYYFGLLPACWE